MNYYSEEGSLSYDEDESSEDGFMKGYSKEEPVPECAECGSALNDEKHVTKEIDGEKLTFCNEACAKEYQESIVD
jgi:hypothetical protein